MVELRQVLSSAFRVSSSVIQLDHSWGVRVKPAKLATLRSLEPEM